MEIEFKNSSVRMTKAQILTSKEVEEQIRTYNYSDIYEAVKGASAGKNSLAESIHFPPINIVFYAYIFLEGKVPSPIELIGSYYGYYKNELILDGDIVKYAGDSIKKIDIDARLLRTYPSLVRDIHFYLLLVESEIFDEVRYSTTADLKGKDIIVKLGDKTAAISLMVGTNRSRKYKRIKNAYRHSYDLPEIVLQLDLSSAAACGDFLIYRESDVHEIKYSVVNL